MTATTTTALPTPSEHDERTPEGIRVRHELLTAVEGLVGEFPFLPAGTVIRCFGRAVREVRAAGVPNRGVAAASEQLARVILQLREQRTLRTPARGFVPASG